MVDRPEALMRPAMLLRVLRGAFLRSRPARPVSHAHPDEVG
ncbi:hypothetical protein AB0C02_29100 [Micromonospora sp. NPDC048999]